MDLILLSFQSSLMTLVIIYIRLAASFLYHTFILFNMLLYQSSLFLYYILVHFFLSLFFPLKSNFHSHVKIWFHLITQKTRKTFARGSERKLKKNKVYQGKNRTNNRACAHTRVCLRMRAWVSIRVKFLFFRERKRWINQVVLILRKKIENRKKKTKNNEREGQKC